MSTMQSIPELASPVQASRGSSSELSSPARSLKNKRSLSILSSNEVTRRSVANESSKPIKQRIISESTGLVKFSLKSNSPIEEDKEQQPPETMTTTTRKQGLPFYIPVDSPKKQSSFSDELMSPFLSPHRNHNKTVNVEEEILFTYAKKQREVLELKSKLEQAEKELKELEVKLQGKKKEVHPNEDQNAASILAGITSPMFEFKKKLQDTNNDKPDMTSPIKQVIRSKVSMLSFSNPVPENESTIQKGLSRQQSIMKIKQDFNDMSNNLITDGKRFQTGFLAKSKNFMNNFPNLGGNDFNLGLANTAVKKPAKDDVDEENINEEGTNEEENFKFNEKDYYSDNDMTYSSDQTDFIEDLEGGRVVPFEIV